MSLAHCNIRSFLGLAMLAVFETHRIQKHRVGTGPSAHIPVGAPVPLKPSQAPVMTLSHRVAPKFRISRPLARSFATATYASEGVVPVFSIGQLPRVSVRPQPRGATGRHAWFGRGPQVAVPAFAKVVGLPSTPSALFNHWFLGLAVVAAVFKFASRDSSTSKAETPSNVKALQLRYLPVFWMLRMADWLQGPYFYEVYASKVFGGQKASLDLISRLFLTGFGATALLGPLVGRLTDQNGRKLGTIAFTIFYIAGALSTKSVLLWILVLGRLAGGIGTSLLFSAPEAWLVGEAQRVGATASLGGIFGAAYAGDALVAIIAGQIAQSTAGIRGPSGPFEVSTLFLVAGAALAGLTWKENKAVSSASSVSDAETGPTIKEAAQMVLSDKKMVAVGAVQALFEGSMYIFVLQWPPAVVSAVTRIYGSSATTPFGVVFSCFMLSCLLGSTIFGVVAKKVRTEVSTLVMLSVATLAMAAGTGAVLAPTSPLTPMVASFFLFEVCVGMYFPSISTLRSKYIPDSHRSVIMNLFGIPLNALVVSVFLCIKRLGVGGALSIASGALFIAMASMLVLVRSSHADKSTSVNPPDKGDADDSA